MARVNRVNNRIRARQIEATDLYLSGLTYGQVAKRTGYSTEAGARWAVNAELKRRRASNDERRDVVGGQLQKLVAAYIGAALAGKTAEAHVALTALRDLSRLYGLNKESVGVAVSEVEFGIQMAQIAEVLGPERLAEAVRNAPGVPRELVEKLPSEPIVDTVVDPTWSNIGGPDIDTEDIEQAEPEPVVVVAERPLDDDHDDGDEEITETVEAELVEDNMGPRPPGQRTIRRGEPEFSGVLVPAGDGTMIPMNRSGIGRRLGGYSPLQHWRP